MPGAICWWCVMHILVLCKFSAFTRAQPIIVTITPSSNLPIPAVQQASVTYIFNCSATSASGPPTDVTWTSYPAGTVVRVGPLTTSGSTTSRPLTLPSPVVLSYVGLYVCTASANGVSTTASYAFNVTVSHITIGNTVPELTGTVGGSIATICSANIGGTTDRPLDFQWIGPTGAVMSSSGRIHVENVTTMQNQGLTFYTSTLTFSTLSSQDNNSMYQCSVGTLYTPYSTQYTPSSSMTTVVVSALTLSPTISSPSCQQAVLQLNCTAAIPLSVVPPVVFSWYRGSGGIFSPLGPGVPGTSVTPQGANVSTLTIAGSSVGGSYVYQCKASVAVPDDVPVVAYATTGVVNFSLSGMVSGLTLQSSGQLMWEAPVVNCNPVSYYTVTMTTYSDGTLVEMGTTPQQYYTLTRSYAAGIPFIATVWAIFGTKVGGNTSQIIFSQELAPSGTLNIMVTSINGSTILLSWKPLSPVEARGFVRYYLVTWTPGTRGTRGTTGGGTANLTADTTTFLITGLDPMVTYMVSVSAGTIAGVGATTNTTAMPTGSAPTASAMPTVQTPVATTSPAAAGSLNLIIAIVVPIAMIVTIIIIIIIIIICVVLIMVYRNKRKRHADDLHVHGLHYKGDVMDELPGGIQETPSNGGGNQSAPVPKSAGTEAGPMSNDDTGGPGHKEMSTKTPTTTTAIPLHELPGRIKEIREKKAEGFKKMFKDLHKPVDSGTTPDLKERFNIDAILIDGYKRRNAYIATQGPLWNTVKDFWRMVWEFKSRVIVMLCPLTEKAVVPFWPTKAQYHTCGVSCESSREITSNSVVYQLKVTTADQSHEVSLYHYTGWPVDDDRPDSDDDVELLHTFCSGIQASDGPITVVGHGIGRISAFITIHAMMEMAREEQKVDFIKFINSSRVGCPDFIRCVEHLKLCYDVLSHEASESTQV